MARCALRSMLQRQESRLRYLPINGMIESLLACMGKTTAPSVHRQILDPFAAAQRGGFVVRARKKLVQQRGEYE
jgi:hypothetical protein